MKMKSMRKLIFAITICLMCTLNTYAKETIVGPEKYTFTEKEKEYIIDFYGEDYLENMSTSTYKWIKSLDIDTNGIAFNKTTDTNVMQPNGTYVQTADEMVGISRSCDSSFCSVTVLARWLNNPTIRSYDVIGVRYYNTSAYGDAKTTIVTSSAGSTAYSNYRSFSNGFGNSVKLPTSGSNIVVEQHLYVKPTGRIYASYQHAMRNTTLATSKLYNISGGGNGSVFEFTGAAANNLYDDFPGVDIAM